MISRRCLSEGPKGPEFERLRGCPAQDLYCLTPVGGLCALVDVNTELSPPDRVIGPAVCSIAVPVALGSQWLAQAPMSLRRFLKRVAATDPPAPFRRRSHVRRIAPSAYGGSSSRCRSNHHGKASGNHAPSCRSPCGAEPVPSPPSEMGWLRRRQGKDGEASNRGRRPLRRAPWHLLW